MTLLTPTMRNKAILERTTLEFNSLIDLELNAKKFNFEFGDHVFIKDTDRVYIKSNEASFESFNDGTNIWNFQDTLESISAMNTFYFIEKLRNNSTNINITTLGDSIWWRPSNGSAPPYLNNGTSVIYTEMVKALNDTIFNGKLSITENLTFPGDDVSRAYNRYANNNFSGDVVMICYGANDTKLDTGTEENGTGIIATDVYGTMSRHKVYMEKLVRKIILQRKVPIIIGSTLPRSTTQCNTQDSVNNRNNMILMNKVDKMIATKYGILFIDTHKDMYNYTDEIFTGDDQIHPDQILSHLGKKLASQLIGISSPYDIDVNRVQGSLKLGVRKFVDNFFCSKSPVVTKDPLLWSISGENIVLNAGESIVYPIKTNGKTIIYPNIYIHEGGSVQVGVNFNSGGFSEGETIIDTKYNTYKSNMIGLGHSVAGRKLFIVSPESIAYATNIHKNAGNTRRIIMPLKCNLRGTNSVLIKCTQGSVGVIGIDVYDANVLNSNIDGVDLAGYTSFNDFTQCSEYTIRPNTMPNLTLDLPPNFINSRVGWLNVKTSYTASNVDANIIIQEYVCDSMVSTRENTNGAWSAWKSTSDQYISPIWSVIDDMNDISKLKLLRAGKYFGNSTHHVYTGIPGIPLITGHIIFDVTKVTNSHDVMIYCYGLDRQGVSSRIGIRSLIGDVLSPWIYTSSDATQPTTP